ncbi:MAG: enoyl-CoA hydratase/isomerase family protein [Streptosporangiaceae bacterium]
MTSVTVERDGAVASVILPGPALSLAVKEGLLSSLRSVADDESVRAVMLTGTGRAFCVGQDLAEHAAALDKDPATALDTVREHYNPIVTALTTMPKPVIAGVNGTCVGAGLGFVLACDFVVMAEGAVLGTAFTGIGLTCDSGLSVTLPASVGMARARSLLLRPTTFTAQEAVSWGLPFSLVPADQVRAAGASLAAELAAGPTAAFAETKRLLVDGASRPFAESLEAEGAAQRRLGTTADHGNAVRAFLAKEKPAFQGS